MARAAAVLSVLVMLVMLGQRTASAAKPMDEDMAELARMVRESCHAETDVDLAIIERVNAGAELPEDGKLKCYIKCVMETAGMLSDGAVDVEMVLGLLDDETRAHNEAALRACGTQPGADLCDVAYRTQLCWQRANRDDYFLI